jgi:hypothetical protein
MATSNLVFVRGGGGLVYFQHNSNDQGWSPWQQLPGSIPVLSFSLDRNGPRVNVYALGADGKAYHWQSLDMGATWQGPEDLGGLGNSPAVGLFISS